jgi:5'-deoxynucleotidase YfbR-like HD superfamily hydrolase
MTNLNDKQFINLLDEGGRKRAYEALYHGTSVELNVGDIIDPAKSARPGRNLAFSTPSLSAAKRFSKNDEGSLGFVYQVEPVDTEDLDSTWAREMKYFKPRTTEVVSNKGFRVVKRIHPR